MTSVPSPQSAVPVMRFGRVELRPLERQLLVGGAVASLGSRAFDLLLVLAERAGQLVSKNQLLDLVWPDVVVEENNLQAQISQLRKVLGSDLISTIPGRGYRFTARIDASDTAPAAPAAARGATPAGNPAKGALPDKLRTNLPKLLPPLVGRDDDLVALEALLERHHLISVIGPGGMGKTLLTQTLLQARRAEYEHGVCFVELASTADSASVASTVGAALGVNIGGSGDAVNGLVATVASLSMLIAIDNAEHLIDGVGPVVEALLAGAPKVHVLVTSQIPLKLAGERIYRLGALAVPESPVSAEDAMTFGAVALFVERAQAAERRFELTDSNVAVVADICGHLDGLALAIELAAARLPLLGLPALSAALDQRLRLLTGGSRSAPLRQQTLRAALEWSHGLLGAAEQTVFRRLGVFAGSASLQSIQRVVADEAADGLDSWAVLDALGALVDHSLVVVLADPKDSSALTRYRLLDTPRAYARERLVAAGEATLIEARHGRAMYELFEREYDNFWGGHVGVDTWRLAMQSEFEDGRAAIAWALREDPCAALSIATTLSEAARHHFRRENAALWQAIENVLDGADAAAMPTVVTGRAALACASLWQVKRPKAAWARAQQAIALLRHSPDRGAYYRVWARVASAAAVLRDWDSADAALTEMRRLEDPRWSAIVRLWGAEAEAFACHFRGNYDGALRWFRTELNLAHEAGLTSTALNNIADAALAAGRIDEAISGGSALVEQLSGGRHQYLLAVARVNLAAAHLARGDTRSARSVAERAWSQAAQFDLQPACADHLALLAALEGRLESAARLLGYADAAYLADGGKRPPNEEHSAQRALQLVQAALDVDALEKSRAAGTALHDEEIGVLAFAPVHPEVRAN